MDLLERYIHLWCAAAGRERGARPARMTLSALCDRLAMVIRPAAVSGEFPYMRDRLRLADTCS